MALKLSLKPGEKFVINGAVAQNGKRRANLVLFNKVSILRQKDIMLEEEANTPVKRIYFAIMMMYLSRDGKSTKRLSQEFVERISEFMNVIQNKDVLAQCVNIIASVQSEQYYKALSACNMLLPFEKAKLDHVSPETIV